MPIVPRLRNAGIQDVWRAQRGECLTSERRTTGEQNSGGMGEPNSSATAVENTVARGTDKR